MNIFPFGGLPADSAERNDSENRDPQQFEKKLEVAIEHFYQTRWDEATDSFADLKEGYPQDPRPYFFESMMPFWEYFFVHQKSELADLFLKRSEKALQLSKEKLDLHPSDTTMVLLLSGLHGYRSLVAAGEKNYRVAIQSGITGFSYTRQLLAIDSGRPDAQVGRGMFYYMMGSVPNEVRWLTNAAGLKGDVELGFEELEKAAASENMIRYDAQMMLMYLHEKEGNFEQALSYAEQLAGRFQENVIFHYKCGNLYEITGQHHRAIDSYNKVIAENNRFLTEISEASKERVEALKTLGAKNY